MEKIIFKRLLSLVNSALWSKQIDESLFTQMDESMWNDLYLNNAYLWFRNRFDTSISEIAHSRKKMTEAFHIPQGIIECYVVIAMILFVIIGGKDSDVRITIGILSVAVLRILPSLRTLITMAIQWKNNTFTMCIIKDIHLPSVENEVEEHGIFFREHIKIDNVSFAYPGKKSFIFENLSLNINKGECPGIQGISGIGKTTLFNLLLGFYQPLHGKIKVDDITLNKYTYATWHKLIAYVPQDIFIMDSSLPENIALGAEEIDDKRMCEVIDKSGLKEFITSLPDGVYTRIGKRMFLIGRRASACCYSSCLIKNAEVLLLDEATSSLDVKTEKDIMDTIYKLSEDINNLTIVIISHKYATLSGCDRIVYMK